MKQYKNTVNTSTHITKTPTQYKTHTYTHYKTHMYTHYILQNKLKQPQLYARYIRRIGIMNANRGAGFYILFINNKNFYCN